MQIIWLNFSPWNKQQKRLNFSQAKDQPKGTKQGLDLWQQLAICTGGCLGPRTEGLHHSVPKPCIPAILSASGKQETHSMLWVAHNKSITHPKLPFSNSKRVSQTRAGRSLPRRPHLDASYGPPPNCVVGGRERIFAFRLPEYAKWVLWMHLPLEAVFATYKHCAGCILRLGHALPMLLETALYFSKCLYDYSSSPPGTDAH